MLDKVTWETFAPLIGQKFLVSSPEHGQIEFELTDVEQLPVGRRRSRNAASTRRAPFSLFFVATPLLPQSIYPMRNPSFGEEPLTIFIVPVGEAEGGGYEYEAVFT